jgi:hypothetical protein
MSWEMTKLVLEADLPPGHKLIMWGIANHTDPDGKGCWAANERLEYYSGFKERQVQRIIKSLEELGYIKHVGFSKTNHRGIGTNVWDIQVDKIPMKPEYHEWQREKRQAEKDAKEREKEEKEKGVKMAPISFGDISSKGCHSQQENGVIHDKKMSQMTPEPLLEPLYKNHSESLPKISQNGSADAKVSPADAGGVGLVADDDPWNAAAVPAQAVQKDYLSENRDDEYERSDPDGNDDARTYRKMSPLEQKIAQLTGSKSLTDAQRASLNSFVMQSYGNQLPQRYPSPEEEWRTNPKLFNDYVELCDQLIRGPSGRNPSRRILITTIRNYARPKSGWLFFKDFKEKAAAPTKQVQKQYYHNPATPSWRA